MNHNAKKKGIVLLIILYINVPASTKLWFNFNIIVPSPEFDWVFWCQHFGENSCFLAQITDHRFWCKMLAPKNPHWTPVNQFITIWNVENFMTLYYTWQGGTPLIKSTCPGKGSLSLCSSVSFEDCSIASDVVMQSSISPPFSMIALQDIRMFLKNKAFKESIHISCLCTRSSI